MILHMKTEAAILFQTKKDLVVDEICIPDELLSGQVLVEVLTSGICGAQINEIDAVKGEDRFLPHLLGHEGLCRVISTAKNVTNVKCDDFAIMHWRPGLGIESNPPTYKWKGKNLYAGWVTSFNRHAIISENRLTAINPASTSIHLLPILGCALTTAYGVLVNEAKVKENDNVIIFGAGGVGLCLLSLLQYLGVNDVTLVETFANRIEIAKSIGAKRVIRFSDKQQVLSELKSLFGGDKPNIAIETSGSTDSIEIAYEITRQESIVLLVGVPKLGQEASIYTLPLHFGKKLVGSKGGASFPHRDIPFLLKEIQNNRIKFEQFPINTYSLNDINLAVNALRTGLPGRMIIDMNPDYQGFNWRVK